MKFHSENKTNRRSFLQKTGAAFIGGTITMNLANPSRAFGAKKDTLKIALIGCGGRGTGAALQALKADPDVVITMMADIFSDRLEESYNALVDELPDKVKVNKENKLLGFDAYKKVIESDVDVVLLTTPPAFRPDHFTAAINAGKHVFCEKPVAVDAPGVRKVLAAAKKAKEKNLSVVSGFCFRYDYSKRAFFERLRKGLAGDITSISTVRNGGQLWTKPRQPQWSEMEYQMRNWMYYNWLSGDFILEMMVHSLDLMSWAMNDQLPVKAIGTGGRQVRVEEIYGNIYDHFAIEYEYKNGIKGFHFSRQQEGCYNTNHVDVAGTLGRGKLIVGQGAPEISGKNKWTYKGEENNMYQTQHDELFAAIRKGSAINDGEKMANSTMLGVLGRMVAYTGQTITWEEAINSNEVLGPLIDQYSWDLNWKGPGIAKPGITKFT